VVGVVKTYFKTPRVKNPEHLKRVRGLSCYLCGVTPCDPHHLMRVPSRGMGVRSNDDEVIPLCRACHQEVHSVGDEREIFKAHGESYDRARLFAADLYRTTLRL